MNMHTQVAGNEPAEPYLGAPARESPETPRRRWLKPLLIALGVLGLALVAWRFLAPGDKPDAAPAATVPTVTVVVPGTSAVAEQITVTGSIAARRDALVGVNGEGGLVTAVLVEAGQFVKKGQVLARIDSSVQKQQVASMAASIAQAKADAALAQANLNRSLKLVDKGFVSRADIDQKTATRDGNLARVGVAQAQYDEMAARLARLDVRAPSNGLVLARSVETGQIVGAGSNSLFRIAENGAIEMRALVAEQDLAKLRAGMPATVRLVGSNATFAGRIWLIDPVIDNISRQGVARIALTYGPGLRVGAFANASIAGAIVSEPVLPQSAVQVDGNTSYVYVVGKDNKVERRVVTVGQVTAQGLGIARGLDGREKVVATSAAFLQPGEPVVPVVRK